MSHPTPVALVAALAVALVLLPSCVTVESEPPPRFVITRTNDQVTWLSSRTQELLIDAVKLERTQFTAGSGVLTQLTTAERVQQAAVGVRHAMERALGSRYPLVEVAGEGVLVMELVVTDQVSEVRLLGQLDSIGGSSAGQLPRVGVQARFWDGETGELVAALITLRESAALTYALGPDGGEAAAATAFFPLATRLRDALDRSWDWNAAMGGSR